MRHRLSAAVVVGICMLAAGGLASLSFAAAVPSAAARTSFTTRGELADVAAISARNAWAVGGTNGGRTLIVHWDGTSWRQMPSPRGSLSGVAAVSAHNVWAVGQTAARRALILHWNGTSWSRVPSPGPAGVMLTSVAALDARNAWAVGWANSSVTLHWNGHNWKQVPSPSGMLSDVVSISARDVWAVGSFFDKRLNEPKPLIVHWTGSAWRRVTAPGARGNGSVLHSVAAVSGRPTWTVGCDGCSIGGVAQSLVAQWTGHGWARRPHPRPGGGNLLAVASLSGRQAWAVGGRYSRPGDSFSIKTLIERWSGRRWAPVRSASPGAEAILYGAAAISARNAWAVGSYDTKAGNSATTRTLILHWNGTRWR